MTGLVVEPDALSFVDVVTSSHAHEVTSMPGTLPAILSGGCCLRVREGKWGGSPSERAGRRPDAVLGVDDEAMLGDVWIKAVPAYQDDVRKRSATSSL